MLVQSCCSKSNLLIPLCSLCRDLVHRQTASAVVQHMSLGVYGFGCEDSLNHLLNYVWPNVFETSPHVIQAVMGALEGLRVAIGPCRMLQYCLQVWPCVCWGSRDSCCQARRQKSQLRMISSKGKTGFLSPKFYLNMVFCAKDLNNGNRQ